MKELQDIAVWMYQGGHFLYMVAGMFILALMGYFSRTAGMVVFVSVIIALAVILLIVTAFLSCFGT